jgi:hypothetical protein
MKEGIGTRLHVHDKATSLIVNATFPTMTGNPPADAARPSSRNGMIVTVVMKVKTDPKGAQHA